LVDAIDKVYLAPITLPETGQLLNNIRDVLAHLFEMQGKITPHQVKMRKIAIYNMNYTIALPVNHVFTAVSELRELAKQANTPMSEPLLTALAYVVLSKEPLFQQDFRTWLMRPEAKQTWSNMLIHFRSAQNYLSCVPTAGSQYTQGYENHHHAPMLPLSQISSPSVFWKPCLLPLLMKFPLHLNLPMLLFISNAKPPWPLVKLLSWPPCSR
jgi:hypothetical protein